MSVMKDDPIFEQFYEALLKRKFDIASILLLKVDVDRRNNNGKTYLMRACEENEVEVFAWLLRNNANYDIKDNSGRNLLFMAITSRSMDIIQCLANHKLHLHSFYKGETALHEAVYINELEIVKILVRAGLHSDVQNKDRKTSLDVAQAQDDKTILQWLVMEKSFEILDGTLSDEGKVAALDDLFSKYGKQYLNDKCPDRNITIAQYAADQGQIGVLNWLKSNGIPVDEALLSDLTSMPMETYNILLVGETGVGKSTFINAFMNYLNFETLEQAENSETIHSLIPVNFTVTDEKFNSHQIKFGTDANESMVPGASATQAARSYVFEIGHVKIRLIDTPGIGDTRGIGKDEENFDELLTVISELKNIHGICILLKPNNARLTVLFEYCIKQLLSRLQKDASQNIMFLFTNSRSTFYRPGDTITPLKNILKQIRSTSPFINIPFGNQNVFCIDNEAFRFLIARKNNIKFDKDEKENFSKSWTKSAQVSIQLLKYIISLKPHNIQETVSLNEARHVILKLGRPVADVAELIQANIRRNDRYTKMLSDKSKDIDDLKQYLMVPRIGIKVIRLDFPTTVCTNQNCTDAIQIQDTTKKNYKQICHERCFLKEVQKEVVGDHRLKDCDAMIDKYGAKVCKHASCGHSFREHMHIYYKTEPFNYESEDISVAKNIDQNKVDMQVIENKIIELTNINEQYRNEMEIIQESMAKFAQFFKNNAITPYNDIYRKYIEFLIDNESKEENGGDKKRIDSYQKLISTYENYKTILDTQLAQAQQSDPNQKAVISAEDVTKLLQELYKLPLSGETIKECYTAQKHTVNAEILKITERTVRPRMGLTTIINKWYKHICSIFIPGYNTRTSDLARGNVGRGYIRHIQYRNKDSQRNSVKEK